MVERLSMPDRRQTIRRGLRRSPALVAGLAVLVVFALVVGFPVLRSFLAVVHGIMLPAAG
jgi:Flp pilus assembly protein TadB